MPIEDIPVYANPEDELMRGFVHWLNRHGYVLCRYRQGIRAWTPATDALYRVIEGYAAARRAVDVGDDGEQENAPLSSPHQE